jgi:hypothetical protein
MNTERRFDVAIWSLWACIVLGMLWMQGCSTYGGVDIDTTRKQLLVATVQVRDANKLLQDLIARDAISRSDAQNSKDALQEAANGIQVALDAIEQGGDPRTAERQLDTAQSAVQIALLILVPIAEANP